MWYHPTLIRAMLIRIAVLIPVWLLQPGLAHAQPPLPAAPCGATVQVMRGDTLSRIAERCNVSEALLMRANPGILGSDDLRAGMELRLQPGEPDLSARLDQAVSGVGRFVSQAGAALNDLAQQVGASVDDLLDRNPDLHNRLRQLGARLGVPGANPGVATASISPTRGPPGTAVTISALGLPANTPVEIGAAVRHSAYEVLDRARTSGDGTLQTTVPVPRWAPDPGQIVFVIASPDRAFRIRSEPFQVINPARP